MLLEEDGLLLSVLFESKVVIVLKRSESLRVALESA